MRAFGLVSLVIVVGVGFYLFNRSANTGPGGMMPQQQIDTIANRQSLLAISGSQPRLLGTGLTAIGAGEEDE